MKSNKVYGLEGKIKTAAALGLDSGLVLYCARNFDRIRGVFAARSRFIPCISLVLGWFPNSFSPEKDNAGLDKIM